MLKHPHELRQLANWYRDLTALEGELDRTWHMTLIDFLESRALEIEESRIVRPVATPDYRYPHGLLGPAND